MKDIFLIIITTVERAEFYLKPDSHLLLWITFEITSHKNSNQTLWWIHSNDLPDESLSCSFPSVATRHETVYIQVTQQNSISRSSSCEGGGLCSSRGLYRSCERSLRSLDQESPPKKKKLQPTYTSTTHLLAGKKCPSSLQTKSNDMETTVFYIPGVDVKVSISLCVWIVRNFCLFFFLVLKVINSTLFSPPVALQLQDPEDRVAQRLARILPPPHLLERVQAVWYER